MRGHSVATLFGEDRTFGPAQSKFELRSTAFIASNEFASESNANSATAYVSKRA